MTCSPNPRTSIEVLRHREYWTPAQASRVLGRSAHFWREAFDRKWVEGYRGSGYQQRRYIRSESARAFLEKGGEATLENEKVIDLRAARVRQDNHSFLESQKKRFANA
jgi:hypothetical protein